jgi:hypothetical protein
MRSREAAQRILLARIDTGIEPKRASEKRPNQVRRAAGFLANADHGFASRISFCLAHRAAD